MCIRVYTCVCKRLFIGARKIRERKDTEEGTLWRQTENERVTANVITKESSLLQYLIHPPCTFRSDLLTSLLTEGTMLIITVLFSFTTLFHLYLSLSLPFLPHPPRPCKREIIRSLSVLCNAFLPSFSIFVSVSLSRIVYVEN